MRMAALYRALYRYSLVILLAFPHMSTCFPLFSSRISRKLLQGVNNAEQSIKVPSPYVLRNANGTYLDFDGRVVRKRVDIMICAYVPNVLTRSR
jgi:hypothetical protein